MKILITGAGTGIGKATAIALAERNYKIFAGTYTHAEMESLKKETDGQKNMHIFILDVTAKKDRASAADLNVDILINNAGIGESGPLAEIPIATVKNNFKINVFGTLRLTQIIVQQFLKHKKNGRVITVSSVAGKITLPYLGAYSMTKHALEAMSDALRQELKPHGIRVSTIHPGPIGTGFNERMNESKYKWFNKDSLFYEDQKRIRACEESLVSNQHGIKSVVQAIIHAVESKNPKNNYYCPKRYGWLTWLSNVIPSKIKEWYTK